MTPSAITTQGRWPAVRTFLEAFGAQYTPLEHERAMTALEEAVLTGYPPEQVAKVVIVHNGHGPVLLLLPASHRVARPRLRHLLGAHAARLASEAEIAEDFPLMEVGATSPVGPGMPERAFIDWRLIEQDRVVFPGGDHRHSYLADPREVVRITRARVAHVCSD
jgi:prolyl-tRNA editing enzyme YbaK/EbsC (Cys-tRNA(Pro) deacylase)